MALSPIPMLTLTLTLILPLLVFNVILQEPAIATTPKLLNPGETFKGSQIIRVNVDEDPLSKNVLIPCDNCQVMCDARACTGCKFFYYCGRAW